MYAAIIWRNKAEYNVDITLPPQPISCYSVE